MAYMTFNVLIEISLINDACNAHSIVLFPVILHLIYLALVSYVASHLIITFFSF